MNTRDTGKHLSMNLGQAAAVCLYEIAREQAVASRAPAAEPLAPAGEAERLTALLAEVMQLSGYTQRHPANAREPSLRRLVRRMALAPGDAAVWSGVLKAMLRRLTGNP